MLITAWWQLNNGAWIHVTALLDDPNLKRHLPLLDQLALELELNQPDEKALPVD